MGLGTRKTNVDQIKKCEDCKIMDECKILPCKKELCLDCLFFHYMACIVCNRILDEIYGDYYV